MSDRWKPDIENPCMCEDCGLTYPEASWGGPATQRSYTCDDCGGYVGDADETKALMGGTK